jgi:leucyl-tRNA synthetase
MRGFNVLHPMGLGRLRIGRRERRQRHPRDWTLQNIAAMKKTLRRFGFSFDWDREVSTCEPDSTPSIRIAAKNRRSGLVRTACARPCLPNRPARRSYR